MNKKVARIGLYFYIINMIMFLLFPKKLFGNIYYLAGYLTICLVLIFFIYRKRSLNHI